MRNKTTTTRKGTRTRRTTYARRSSRSRSNRKPARSLLRMPLVLLPIGALVAAAGITAVSLFNGNEAMAGDESSALPEVTLAYSAGDANCSAPHLPPEWSQGLRNLALGNGTVHLAEVNGDGAVTLSTHELTPTVGAEELTVPELRENSADAAVARIDATLRDSSSTVAGRSMWLGLQQISRLATAGPIWVLTCGLELGGPLDFATNGFDPDPRELGDFLARTDNDVALAGREISIAILPVAGAQKLDQPRVRAVDALWTTLLTDASGAAPTVIGVDYAEPHSSTVVPTIPLPAPIKFNSEDDDCRVDSAATFFADSATFIDQQDTIKALRKCAVAELVAGTMQADLTGHFSSTRPSRSNKAGMALAKERAQQLATLLTDRLGVPVSSIGSVTGSATPLVKDPADPANRAVIITLTPQTAP